jgi:hypothetical protein
MSHEPSPSQSVSNFKRVRVVGGVFDHVCKVTTTRPQAIAGEEDGASHESEVCEGRYHFYVNRSSSASLEAYSSQVGPDRSWRGTGAGMADLGRLG